MKLIKILFSLSIVLVIHSCADKRPPYTSPEGYDLTAPEKMIMKESLLEISGITFHSEDTLLALNDEEGKIFFVPWMGQKNRNVKFGHNGDYEDVTKYKNWIFALRSDGTIYSFPDSITQRTKAKKLGKTLPKGDYESLYADESENKLYVLCKTCKFIEDSAIQGYVLSLINDSIADVESFKIELNSYTHFERSGKKVRFAPSSIAKNKLTNEWYIISALNKTLLIVDKDWNVKAAHPLNPLLFNQPEGIAFDHLNNLYISNEGDELLNGNVLKFIFQAKEENALRDD